MCNLQIKPLKMNTLKAIITIATMAAVLTACKKDEDPPAPATPPPPVNEGELITTVRIHLTSMDGTEEKQLLWVDLDGDGGDAPVITWDTLSAGTTYQAHIELLDQSVVPPDDITVEIEEEDEEHQFFYIASGANATISYADQDEAGNPVGLQTVWTLGAASTGNLTVILRHDPDKFGEGVAAGDITNAGGDTDVEVVFPLIIQ